MEPRGNSPVAVGTQGTIGALVRKEMEYFHGIGNESASFGSRRWPAHAEGMSFVKADARVAFGFCSTNWLRKNQKGCHGRFELCKHSVMRVAKHCRRNKVHNTDVQPFGDEIKNQV
ncbi:hypothetical protein MLD38_019399 [Melastoma candidum]|uniref:Uncharacterized protein n=1 Tax=Melastoma candidum TaxID=119954 RepID=A0ACB9R0X7_9MYRT|nr:hypothetical protein MLD38_019399 [Melastoma candidum]